VKARIEHGLKVHQAKFTVIPAPNITNIFYNWDLGYSIGRSTSTCPCGRSRRPRSGKSSSF